MLRAIAGLQDKVDGTITINDIKVLGKGVELAPENRKVGFIFQDYALFPHLNVFDNIAFSLFKQSKKQQQKKVEDVLALVQLSRYADRFPHQLSGGQQQRISIARALAYQPDLMLLDEPFSNLDQHVRLQLIQDIRHLFKAHQISALFVTHAKEEGFAFADKIALMQAGKIVQIGSAKALYYQPISRYVADFMGQSNYLQVQVQDDTHYSCALGLISSARKIKEKIGEHLLMLVRPEHLLLHIDENAQGEVIDVLFLGAYVQVKVRYKSDIYTLKQSSLQPLEVGCRVSLALLEHDFVFFDLAS